MVYLAGLGTPTVWGRWDPDTLNNQRYYSDERGLNSMAIISMLRSGAFITGDAEKSAAYDAAISTLVDDHGYGTNAINARITVPGDVNYSDDELALFPLYAHLALTPGAPAKDLEMVCSMARYWEQGTAAERASIWAAMHAAVAQIVAASEHERVQEAWAACGGVTADGFYKPSASWGTDALVDINTGTPLAAPLAASIADDSATAAWSLRNWVMDFVTWGTRNSHRADVILDARIGTRFVDDSSQGNGRVLPNNERGQYRWNHNPKILDDNGLPGGTSEEEPSAFLLGYWMSRYHGLIGA